jgi:hypothetical protein
MTEPTVTCPNCRTEIPLTESLAAPLIRTTEAKYERLMAQKEKDISAREAALRDQQAAIENAQRDLDKEVTKRLSAQRSRIATEEADKAKRLLAADMERTANELGELKLVLKQREEKLAEAQKAQAELMRKERELEDAKREMELTVEKKVHACLNAVRAKAKMEAEDELKLRVTEKEAQIASMSRQIEDLKRKAEQGSQQLQGEVLEVELEALLRSRFPQDNVEPVPKGELGGDLLQHVMNPAGQRCGTILWESKRTKNWNDGWLAKIREDQRRAKADVALIVTSVLPKGTHSFDHVDGVWITHPRCAIPVALALRHSLVEIASARQATEGQQTKAEEVYAYLTGPRFRQRLEAIVEKFGEMQGDLDKERRAMTRLWAKREAQIQGVIEATAGLYGDLQGIAGKVMQEIDGFALPMIEDNSSGDDGSIAA